MSLTIANQLTILRLFLIPAIVILIVYGHYSWALVVFLIAGVTDALDGLFARMRNEQTRLGMLLDPAADKLLVMSCLIVLSLPHSGLAVRIPPWVAILSISRDVAISLSVLLFYLTVGSRAFPPSVLGKATSILHIAMIFWVILGNALGRRMPSTDIFFGLTVVLVVASGLHYAYQLHHVVTSEEGESKVVVPDDGADPPR